MASKLKRNRLAEEGPGFYEALLVFAVFVLLEAAVNFVALSNADLIEKWSSAQGIWFTGAVRFIDLSILVFYWKLRGWSFSALGLTGSKAKKGMLVGIAGCAAFGAAVFIGEAALRISGGSLLNAVKGSRPTPVALAALVVIGGFAAPLCEEAVFRGLLYRGLRKRFSPFAAMGAVTLLFASAHLASFRLLQSGLPPELFSVEGVKSLTAAVIVLVASLPWIQAIGGFVFCLAYEFSESLWAPVIIHSVGNLAIFSLPFLSFL